MAQSGYTPILIYASGTATNVPLAANMTSSASGAELALNYADGKLYFKNSSGVVTLLAGSAAAAGTFTSLTDSGNLTFTGTGNRITGDFSNATLANRVTFQTSTSNSVTFVSAIPNGTGTNAAFGVYGVNDPTNSIYLAIRAFGTTETRIDSGYTGTASASPLTFYTGGSERLRIDTSGNVGIGTASPASKLQLSSSAADTRLLATKTDTSVTAQMGSEASTAYVGSYTNHPLVIRTNDTERARFDTSGNVGIGTSSPGTTLDVNGTITSRASGAEGGQLTLNNPDNVAAGLILDVSTANVGRLFQGINNSTLQIGQIVGTGGTVSLYTASSERMRIDSSGNLLVATTNSTPGNGSGNNVSGFAVSTNGTTWASRSGFEALSVNRVDTTGGVLRAASAGTQVGGISVTSSATAFNTSSDYRLKQDIAPMTGALIKVAALKPVTYKWKRDGSDGEGFIAHELAEVCPQAVTGDKDAVDADGNPVHQGIDTSFLVATLTAAIQEQQALIISLTARIATLESK